MTRILTLALILVGSTLSAAPPLRESPAFNWRIVDAEGQFVAYTTPSEPQIGIRMVDGRWIRFALDPAGILEQPLSLFYDSADCTGQGWVEPASESFTVPQIGAIGSVLYFAPLIQAGTIRTTHSRSAGDSCQPNYTVTALLAAPLALDMGPLHLVPPFSLVR